MVHCMMTIQETPMLTVTNGELKNRLPEVFKKVRSARVIFEFSIHLFKDAWGIMGFLYPRQ